MSFIVIEGDNGTGKDTLALKLKDNLGYSIITNEPKIKELNKQAKCFTGKKRIIEFLKYGKVCSNQARIEENAVVVRYWISTLAAAYADKIYNYEQVRKIENEIYFKYYKPDIVICLWCDFEARIKRIKNRKSTDFDDITKERSQRYRWYLKEYQKKPQMKWINIDTTNKTEKEVFDEVCKYINNL